MKLDVCSMKYRILIKDMLDGQEIKVMDAVLEFDSEEAVKAFVLPKAEYGFEYLEKGNGAIMAVEPNTSLVAYITPVEEEAVI